MMGKIYSSNTTWCGVVVTRIMIYLVLICVKKYDDVHCDERYMHTIVMIANRGFVKSTKSHIYLTIGWKLSKVTLVLFNANCFWTNLFKSVSEPLKKQLRKNSIGIQWVIQHRNSIGNSLKCKVQSLSDIKEEQI